MKKAANLRKDFNLHRDFKGIWMPKKIWFDKRLNAFEKFLLAEIDSLDNDSHCYASNKHLSELLGCSEWQVSRMISKLKSLNLIEQLNFDGRKRILRANLKL